MLTGIFLFSGYLLFGDDMPVTESILLAAMSLGVYLIAISKYRLLVKIAIIIAISAIYHLQIINICVDVKYGPVLFLNNDKMLVLCTLCYVYSLCQQWTVLFDAPRKRQWKIAKLCVALIAVWAASALFVNDFYTKLSHLYLYILPLFHYLSIIVAYIVLQIERRNKQSL
jgi:hypothetical protein